MDPCYLQDKTHTSWAVISRSFTLTTICLSSLPPALQQQDFQPGKSLGFPTTRYNSCLPSVPHFHHQSHQVGFKPSSFLARWVLGGVTTTCSLEPFALPTQAPLSSGACQGTILCVLLLGNSRHGWQTVFLTFLTQV